MDSQGRSVVESRVCEAEIEMECQGRGNHACGEHVPSSAFSAIMISIEAGAHFMKEARHPLMTVAQVAEALQCSERHVYNIIKAGELPARRLGRKMIRVEPDDLEDFIARS